MKFKLLLFFFFSLLQATAQEQFSLFFDSNKYELTPAETQKLQSWMASHADVKIVAIDGFTDEDGSVAHNDTLSQRRVNFVLKQITGKVKVRDDFRTRSFGELHQFSKVKAENRKVTVFYIEAKDLPREDEILGIKKETPVAKPDRVVNYPEKLIIDNPDGTTSEYKLNVDFMQQMTKAKAGEKLAIPNLNFVINTFAIVPGSRSKLYELLLVMQRNPDLKIEIQGHLCCMPVDRLDLSTQRAKAIYMFLMQNNIEKSRLSYKGFGSSQPIFPLPEKTEEERAANRRVEIQIISN